MRRLLSGICFIVVGIMLFGSSAWAAEDVSTYLIMGDIPPYYRLTQAFDAYTDKGGLTVGSALDIGHNDL